MTQNATDLQDPVQHPVQEPPTPPRLPADHVLCSGSVLFPGAFDRHGCPLVVFPADGLDRLSSPLRQDDVLHFIRYCHHLHTTRQEQPCLVSVAADLRKASLPAARFIAETLRLLQLQQKMIHSVYIVQPKKKDVSKLLLKVLVLSKSPSPSFKKVLLKDIPELWNHVDRSQLPSSLGGYLMYSHQSWVDFVKDVDAFLQEFLSVLRRLPSCLSALQAFSRLPLPSSRHQLQQFCSVNEDKFRQIRRELSLDELLRHCESVVEKLRNPETEPCYQDMAGTALFTHTAFDMLHYHSRITAAVEKVELLWQQTFCKAHQQLQLFQLRDDALQTTEEIQTLLQEKLHTYEVHISKDTGQAEMLASEFEAFIHTPAMVLVRRAEDVIHAVAEILPTDVSTKESWLQDLSRLEDRLHSTVHHVLQTLRAVSNHHHYYDKANQWYTSVLHENFLQELLSGVHGDEALGQRHRWGAVPPWRQRFLAFLKKNPCPDMEELVHLAHLSGAIPDQEIRQAGGEMSHRCMALRKLLISSGSVDVGTLQKALQWQYYLLRSEQNTRSSGRGAEGSTGSSGFEPVDGVGGPEEARPPGAPLLSLDPNFDPAAGGRLGSSGPQQGSSGSTVRGQEGREEKLSGASERLVQAPEFDQQPVGLNPPQIKHKSATDSLDVEIKVRRSAALPTNPWLSLPVDDLEKSYAVTVTPKAVPQRPERTPVQQTSHQSRSSQTERDLQTREWISNSLSEVEDPELASIEDVLSSTITDGQETTVCPTEGMQTLLWDSYDLHDQDVDSDSVVDLSDWELKEQEGLRRVEQMLGRADQILEEEEHVVAQEAMLDALVRSEGRSDVSSQWSGEDSPPRMSSWELAEAGVLGLEDSFHPEHLSDVGHSSDHVVRSPPSPSTEPPDSSRSDLMRELDEVHLLDRLIREENLKVHQLHCSDGLRGTKATSRRTEEKEGSVENGAHPDQPETVRSTEELRRDDVEEENCSRSEERPSKEVLHDHCSDAQQSEELQTVDPTTGTGLEPECGDRSEVESPLANRTSDVEKPSEDCEARQCFGRKGLDVSQKSETERLGSFWSSDITEESSSQLLHHDSGGHGFRSAPSSSGEQLDRVKDLCTPEASSDIRPSPAEEPFDPDVDPLSCLQEPRSRSTSFTLHDRGAHPEGSGSTRESGLDEDPGLTKHKLQAQDGPSVDVTSGDGHSFDLHENSNDLNRPSSPPPAQDEDESRETSSSPPTAGIQTPPRDKCPTQPSVPRAPPDGRLQVVQDGTESSESVRAPGDGPSSSMRPVGAYHTPVVLDTGSSLMKAGFSDQDFPQVVFPTIIGMPKYEEIMNEHMERETFIGHEAQSMRGVLALKHPMKNGVIHSWDDIEKIWHHTFQQLGATPEEHPVLLTEAAMNPLENRQRAVELMFESFSVPFGYVAMQAVLALYAEGRTTGVVFDSGDGVSHSVPVFEGYSLPHAVRRLPLAGADVTAHLKKLLQEQGVPMRTTAEDEIVREMKEKCCYVAANYEAELQQGAASRGEMSYTLPDGQVLTLDTERFRAAEILFRPELIGRDHYGMHESVFQSVLRSDVDLRRSFLGNIVLSGGNTLLPGLPERLQGEISKLVPGELPETVRVSSPGHRDVSVWRGGAVLAALPGFSSAWISQEEYEECGPQVVFRKCF